MTYAQERAEKDAAKAKRSKRFVYDPVLFDQINPPKGRAIESGAVVVKIQPHGCPRNGTMGMCYIGDPETGEFIGLVCLNSLTPQRKPLRGRNYTTGHNRDEEPRDVYTGEALEL